MITMTLDSPEEAIAVYNTALEIAERELNERLYDIYVKDLEVNGNDVIYNPSTVIDIESGTRPYDMKEGLLNSPSAHVGENGRYLAVPFTYSKGGSVGGKLPASVYKSLLKMPVKTPTKVDDLPNKYKGSATNVAGYTHKTSIYAGITKTDKRSPSSSKAKYSFDSFRVVSDASPADSWWHKGIEPYNILDRAMEVVSGGI